MVIPYPIVFIIICSIQLDRMDISKWLKKEKKKKRHKHKHNYPYTYSVVEKPKQDYE